MVNRKKNVYSIAPHLHKKSYILSIILYVKSTFFVTLRYMTSRQNSQNDFRNAQITFAILHSRSNNMENKRLFPGYDPRPYQEFGSPGPPVTIQ